MKDINPRNRRKTALNFFLRSIEDKIKNIFLALLVFFSFFYIIKLKGKKKINLGHYIDIYSINFLVHSLSRNYIFTYDLLSSLILLKRLGIKNFFNNCKPNFLFKYNSINIFYNKKEKLKDNEINFNFDYFNFFDKKDFSEVKNKKSLILPYYFKSDFYKKNLIKKFENLRNEKKIYKIIFSGSHHTEWYDQLKWPSSYENKKPILSRTEIINFVASKFEKYVQIIHDKEQLQNIDKNKKILLFTSDPSKKRKLSKILSIEQHMNLIASSQFFLTCPGTAMPICHHIVESMYVGTVPITSYGDLLFPKLTRNNSFKFSNFSDLYDSINKALTINDEEYIEMSKQSFNYYDEHLSPESFSMNFKSLKLPINLYMNVDGHTLDSRRERFGLDRLFPLPNN